MNLTNNNSNNNQVIRFTYGGPLQMKAVRDTVRQISNAMNFNYRIRERKNKNGRYATLTINSSR